MRVLSFIPAILLAAAGFVAAVPTGLGGATSLTDPVREVLSKASPNTLSNPVRRDTPAEVQSLVTIFDDAKSQLDPLNGKLTTAATGTPDLTVVSQIVVEIGTVINATVAKVEAAAKVEVAVGLDLTVLITAIVGVLGCIVVALGLIIKIVLAVGITAAAVLSSAVAILLQAVAALLVVIDVYVVAGGILVAVIAVVVGAGDVLCALLTLTVKLAL